MLSRENSIILTFVVVAVAAAVFIETQFSGLADWIPLAVLLGGGVVVPVLVNSYLDGRKTM
ncbi:MAG: hypothetical protein J07HN4v3_02693 [Halonotius sp. J07HN4]|jgi:hypothetical protein|nr:MAG: hypothetical protein J07HN4v3_02693 [Halonotius sp. J07HN4]